MTQRQKGALYMVLAALSFASMQVTVRICHGIPTIEQVLVRNATALILSAVIIIRKKGSLFGPVKYQPYLFGRSIFGFLALFALFYASRHAAQGDVTILNKLSPIVVTILAVICMKEKLSKIQIPALLLSVAGVFLVFQPSFESNLFPLVMALFSAVASGVAFTFLSFFKGKVDGMTVIMHFSTFSAVTSLPFVLQNFVMPSFEQTIFLLLIGMFGSLGQVFITYSYRLAPASEISIYNYSGIVFSLILGFLFLGEPIALTSVVGGTFVVVASTMVYGFNNRTKNSLTKNSLTKNKKD